jgi:hypothetical protein
VSSIAAGVVQFLERKKVQQVEGKPNSKILSVEDEELKLLNSSRSETSQ